MIPLIVPFAVVAQATDDALFYRDLRENRYRDAVVAGRRYLDAHPKNDSFAFDLAYAYFRLDRFDDVRRTIAGRDAYLRAHPASASIWLDLAYKDGDAKRYPAAIAEIDRYLRFRPADAQAKKQRADDVAAQAPAPAASAEAAALDDSDLFYRELNAQHAAHAIEYGQRFLTAHPENDAFAIDLAFAQIAAELVPDAAAIADRRAAYIRTNTGAAALLAGLFYGFNGLHRPGDAVKYGEEYLALRPDDDAFAMDLAYAELGLGHLAKVRALVSARGAYLQAHPESASIWLDISFKDADAKHYREAIADVDRYLQFKPGDKIGKEQRAAFVDELYAGPRYQSYGYGQYEGRYSDGFFGVDSRYVLAPGIVSPYVASHIVSDLTSGAPGTPQIYSDNAVIVDAGLKMRVSPYASFFAEGGTGIGTRGQGTITDLRYGFNYSQRWGTHAFTEVDASAAIYSRYANNAIAYFSVLHQGVGRRVRPIVGLNSGFDEKALFGNNFAEGFAGLEFGTEAISVRVLQVAGVYFTRGLSAPQTDYRTLRAVLVFGLSK